MLRLNTFGGLWIEGAEAAAEGGVRPRRLALLAVLAVAGPKGTSRDRVLAILWPDSDQDRARHALSQTLYSLRADLGADPVLATASDLRLDTAQIVSDQDDFRGAVAAQQWTAAARIYAGPFLDGFYLSEAPEFERWAEEQRARLARDAGRAIETVARECDRAGRVDESADAWRRLTQLDPLSGRYAAGYMAAAGRLGDRAGALAHGRAYAERLRVELNADPDHDVARLLVALRAGGALPAAEATLVPDVASPAVAPGDPAERSGARRLSPGMRWGVAAGALVLAALIGAVAWRRSTTGPDAPILAVGQVRDLVTPDSTQLGGVLSEMLATSIGRLTSLQVIANSRVLELIPRGADTSRAARTDAARRAGATEVLEGELIPLPDHRLRFDLRRVDLARGLVRRAYQASGTDRLALFDSITAHIATDLGVAPPTGTLAEVSTSSPLAFRLYGEGLRAFYQFDSYAANRLFGAAVAADSTFAMATYYAWRSAMAINTGQQDRLAERAMALASRAPERDRLLIRTHVGMMRWDLAAVPAADSLVARFPNDPEALVRAADVTSDLARATELLNRSIAIDSAAGMAPLAVCRLCEALHTLQQRYDWADSVSAAERTMRRWIRLRPEDYAPWLLMADYLVGLGRRTEAEAALQLADSLGAPNRDADERNLLWSLRSDDAAGANELCRSRLGASARSFTRFRWLCTIALRMQGRYHDARGIVHEGRAPGSSAGYRGIPTDRIHAAILDLEMGQPRAAVAGFGQMAREAEAAPRLVQGAFTRNLAWSLTLEGTASAAAGDTARVRLLADSVEATGRRSLFPRDPLLHHFLRGLLLVAAQRDADAVREFRAAMHSPSEGYTRINLELGRSLLALGRAAEAVPVLRAPLHGGIDGSGLYVTRTEMHEMLARAFAAAGQRDSAAAHFEILERMWRNADPLLAPRHEAARAWLARDGRPAER